MMACGSLIVIFVAMYALRSTFLKTGKPYRFSYKKKSIFSVLYSTFIFLNRGQYLYRLNVPENKKHTNKNNKTNLTDRTVYGKICSNRSWLCVSANTQKWGLPENSII